MSTRLRGEWTARFFRAAALALVLCLFGSGLAHAGTVDGVRIGVSGDLTRVVLELSAPTSFSAFTLDNPSRLVIDVAGTGRPVTLARPTGLVERVRSGVPKASVARFVFDSLTPLEIVKHFSLPPRAGKPERIVVDIRARGKGMSKTVKRGLTVIVDAGHGGKDPGASRERIREKHLTLAAARTLRDILRQRRYRVVMTRDSDVYVPLKTRVEIAKKAGGDLFVSLHADAIGNPKTRGLSVYTLSDRASDRLAAMLARDANEADLVNAPDLDGYDEDVSQILADLAHTGSRNSSVAFAQSLVVELGKSGFRLLNRPHRQAGFAVLKGFDIPSVLIEMGFVSNRSDARLLADSKYRHRLMTRIADHIDRHFSVLLAGNY